MVAPSEFRHIAVRQNTAPGMGAFSLISASAVSPERTAMSDHHQEWARACREIISRCVAPDMYANAMDMLRAAEDAAWNRRAAPTEPAVDRDIEVLTAQVRHERAKFDRCFQILMSVNGLLGPGKDFTLPDGRVMRFNDPNAAETLHHLSAAINAIPEKLAALATPASPAVPTDRDHLLKIIAFAYQIAGAHDAPEHILAVLAHPESATAAQVDAMLPYQVGGGQAVPDAPTTILPTNESEK
jgi:hypothetical protein